MDQCSASNGGNSHGLFFELMSEGELAILSVSGDTKLVTLSHSTLRISRKNPKIGTSA